MHSTTVEGFYTVFKRGLRAFISIAGRSICSVTSPNVTSGITNGQSWAWMMRHEQRQPYVEQLENGEPIT